MDTITKVTLCLEVGLCLLALSLCTYASTMAKKLPGKVEDIVDNKITERLNLRDRVAAEKQLYQNMREEEKRKLGNVYDTTGCYWKQPEKPKQWVAEIFLPSKDSDKPSYRFHCVSDDHRPGGIINPGKHYLFTPTGRGFVTTDNPATAILLQQLLNENQLTVKPFTTNETNQ